jgi:hypothetical protein
MAIAAAPRNSSAASREPTASMLLREGPAKPSSRAVSSRSSGNVLPASAPDPSGERARRLSRSAKRSPSRPNISTNASQWCASRTGWARCRWV